MSDRFFFDKYGGQKIIEAGQGIFGSVNIAKRMQFEYALWKSPANINLSTYAKFLTDKSVTASDNWYTCKNGAISKCYGYGLQKDYSGAWSNMNNPCLPCSIASGGTWGIGNEESPSKLGKYPYSAAAQAGLSRLISIVREERCCAAVPPQLTTAMSMRATALLKIAFPSVP